MPQSGSAQPQSSWLDDVAADIRWDRDDDLRRDGARRTREGRAPAGSRLDRVRRVDDWMAEEPAGDSNWSHQPAPATSPDRFAEPRRQTESPEPRRQTAPRAPADDRAQGQSRTQAESSAVAESLPERRTITITGRGADRGWTPQPARRRPRDHSGRKPDRVAMWAVLLGLALAIGAATSSHAAVLSHTVLSVAH